MKKSRWKRFEEGMELAVGWYWVAYWDGTVGPTFFDSEGEFTTLEDEDGFGVGTSTLVTCSKVHSIMPMCIPPHPVKEDR